MDVGGNLKEEVKEVYNCLVVGNLNKSQNWFFVLHARVVEDFSVIAKMAFLDAWMDSRPVTGLG
jgi:hypothetical protein